MFSALRQVLHVSNVAQFCIGNLSTVLTLILQESVLPIVEIFLLAFHNF